MLAIATSMAWMRTCVLLSWLDYKKVCFYTKKAIKNLALLCTKRLIRFVTICENKAIENLELCWI